MMHAERMNPNSSVPRPTRNLSKFPISISADAVFNAHNSRHTTCEGEWTFYLWKAAGKLSNTITRQQTTSSSLRSPKPFHGDWTSHLLTFVLALGTRRVSSIDPAIEHATLVIMAVSKSCEWKIAGSRRVLLTLVHLLLRSRLVLIGVAQSAMALPAIDRCLVTTIKKHSLKLKKTAKRSSEL